MSDKKPKILIFVDWYIPGYLAGGPIRSVYNLAKQLSRSNEVFVLTGEKDFGSESVYEGVKFDKWTELAPRHYVYYKSGGLSKDFVNGIIRKVNPATVYLNSLYSADFTLLPLFVLKNNKAIKKVMAPRGMLGEGALRIKSFKKRVFLFYSRIANTYKDVTWHVTATSEKKEVLLHFPNATIVQIPNLATEINSQFVQKSKIKGSLNLVYVSRISRKKNILGAIKALNDKFEGNIRFDVYGPMEDKEHWLECEKAITKLPSNIMVSYRGVVKPSKLGELYKDYHFLYFPTTNENFGHVILEAMNCSCPVIISDQTPWRNLEKDGLGWDVDIKGTSQLNEVVHKALDMEEEEYRKMSESAFNFSMMQIRRAYLEEYQKLFGANKKPIILIFVDWYVPGFLAGGPIRSVYNLAKQLSKSSEVFVLTGEKDFGNESVYEGVKFDEWGELAPRHHVYYKSGGLSKDFVNGIIDEVNPDTVYMNSLYSTDFTLLPLSILKNRDGIRKVMAPRGMLNVGALRIKSLKKKTFLIYVNLTNTYKDVIWHVTANPEREEVLRHFPEVKTVQIANVATQISSHFIPKRKIKGELKLVFVSRVSLIKNILGAIKALNSKFEGNILFDIFGPIEDLDYWSKCKDAITRLPDNVIVNYRGVVEPSKIGELYKDYHFLYFPTTNENFGHVILEAMNCSCPVIISDQTPWRNLEKDGLGWDVDIKGTSQLTEVVHKALCMGEDEYERMAERAFNFSLKQINRVYLEEYQKLFFP